MSESSNLLSAISLDSLQATRDHPLFTPSRRPPVPLIPVKPSENVDPIPEPEKPSITLTGVLYSENLRIGIFTDEKEKKIFRARVGDTISGWTLRTIDRRKVLFENAHEQLTMEMKRTSEGTVTVAVTQDPGAPLQGKPVGQLIPFAKTSRSE